MSDRIHAACQNLFRVVNAFSLALQEAPPGDQQARLYVESACANVLNEVDACRRLAPLVPPSPLGDWLRATLLHIEDFRTSYVVPYGIAGCISGVPIDADARTVTALQFPSLTIDPPPADESPTTTQQAEGEKPKPVADPYADLRAFARDNLKGQERAVIEALCDAAGELPIANLAVMNGLDWDDEFEAFKNVQKRLTPKLKRIGWTLRRQNNAAKLNRNRGVEKGFN